MMERSCMVSWCVMRGRMMNRLVVLLSMVHRSWLRLDLFFSYFLLLLLLLWCLLLRLFVRLLVPSAKVLVIWVVVVPIVVVLSVALPVGRIFMENWKIGWLL